MRKSVKIILPILIFIIMGLGFYGGFLYDSAKKIQVEIDNIDITKYTVHYPALTLDLDLQVSGNLSTPSLPVKVDKAYIDIYLENYFIGTGEIQAFIASQTPSPLNMTVQLINLNIDIYLELNDLIDNGNNKTVKIVVTRAIWFGINLSPNYEKILIITKEDVLGI